MPRLAVVLDTNTYRGIGAEAFDGLLGNESHHSVVAYAHYYVATELLAHLADHNDPDFRHCIAALHRLGRHCRRYDGSATTISFMQLPDAQVARVLFNATLASGEPHAGAYATIIGALLDGPTPEAIGPFREALSGLRDQVRRGERQFVEKLWRNVVLRLTPEAGDWHDIIRSSLRTELLATIDDGGALELIAATIVERAASRSGVMLTAEVREQAIQNALKAFPTAVHHHNFLVRELIANGPDMSRPHRANSIWDHEITFATGPGATVGGVPLVLVTSDPLILHAADAAATRRHYWSSAEYVARLEDRRRYIDHFLEPRAP